MRDILSIRKGECRFCITDDTPFYFCGNPVAVGSVYCGPHHRLCYAGFGSNPAALEAMIYSREASIVRQRVRGVVRNGELVGRPQGIEPPVTLPVDVAIRGRL
jgi:hypothetical protein